MTPRRLSPVWALRLLGLTALGLVSRGGLFAQALRYEVWVGQGPTRVTLTLERPGPGPVHLALPRPGSRTFRLRRYVQELSGVAAGGRPCRVAALGPAEWRVETRGAKAVTVRYRLATWTTPRGEGERFFWPAWALLYWVGHEEAPAALRFHLPEGWEADSGLPQEGGWFRARGVRALYDHPALLGKLRTHRFRAAQVPFRLVFGSAPPGDPGLVAQRLGRIATWYREIFGYVPFREYAFLLSLNARRRSQSFPGRVASVHRLPPKALWAPDPEAYRALARSLFQAWNGRAIRPEGTAASVFASTRRSEARWFVEGVSDYYALRALLKTGQISTADFFRLAAPRLERVLQVRRRHHRHRPWSWSRSTSGGFALALCLDVELRRLTGGRKCLDDVLRFLAWWFGREERPYAGNRDLCRAVSTVAARDLGPFFAAHVAGSEPPPVAEALRRLGYRVLAEPNYEGAANWVVQLLLAAGVEAQQRTVRELSRWQPLTRIGLRPGDKVLAVGGVSLADLRRLEALGRALVQAWRKEGAVPREIEVRYRRPRRQERSARLRLWTRTTRLRLVRDPSLKVAAWLRDWFPAPQSERR